MRFVYGYERTKTKENGMSKSVPAGRLQLDEQAPKLYAAMYRLEQSIELDHGLRGLVALVRGARVQAHPHPHGARFVPALREQGALGRERLLRRA